MPTIESKDVFLVFAIEGGDLVWLAAHDDREEAIDHVNRISRTVAVLNSDDYGPADVEDDTTRPAFEFAFVVPSPHFMAMYRHED
jgi:hypothetical protein